MAESTLLLPNYTLLCTRGKNIRNVVGSFRNARLGLTSETRERREARYVITSESAITSNPHVTYNHHAVTL